MTTPDFSLSPGPTLDTILDAFDGIEEQADGYIALCPSHADTIPSLRIGYKATDKKVLIRCRAGCKTEEVLSAVNLSMGDLFRVEPGNLKSFKTTTNVTTGPGVADRAALKHYLDRAADHNSHHVGNAANYAEARFGITTEKFIDLGLGEDDGTINGGSLILSRATYHDAPRLVVPFNDFDGNPHYLQARALHNDVRARWSGPNNPEGASWGRYGLFQGGTGWNEIVITEGPGDALTVAAVGYDAVAIRGAALSSNASLCDEIAAGVRGRKVIVAGDTDTAGIKFTREVAQSLSERGADVYRLNIPEGAGSDITDWRSSLGPSFAKAFVKAIKSAPRYGTDQIVVEEIGQDLSRLFSDVHNAQTLLGVIREQGADVRHTAEVGFVIYRPSTGVWQKDEADWIRSQAQSVAERVQRSVLAQIAAMDTRVAAISDPIARDAVGKILDAQRKKARSGTLVSYVMSMRGIDSMIREMRALPGVVASYEDFDSHPDLLAVANGVVNLETGHLTPYSPDTKDLYLMRRIGVPYSPGARNPRWEQFIGEIFSPFPDNEQGSHSGLPAYMRRLIGYGITGYNTEQCFAVFHGAGSNGKGVLIETITGLFKGISLTTPFATFEAKNTGGIPNDIAAMKGARLVMASEGDQGKPMAEALIKRLTGSDTITARYLHKEFFEFMPQFLLLLATNFPPQFRGQDDGLWRRVNLVPFNRQFTVDDRDPHLTSKFLGRKVPAAAHIPGEDFGDGPEGILAWAVQGAVEWHQVGLAPPPVVSAATDEFKATSDVLGDFYEHCLVKDEDGKISGKDVWNLYREWCDDEGIPSKDQWKRATFWNALVERKARKASSGGATYFRGIRRRRASDGEDLTPEQAPATLPTDAARPY